MLLRMPGVGRPETTARLLGELLESESLGPGTRVLDLCGGTGVLSVRACSAGAGWVTAVDRSHRGAMTTWLNAKLNRQTVRVVCGDLAEPVRTLEFDLILAGPTADPERLERLCNQVPALLAERGKFVLVQAEDAVDATCAVLDSVGLLVAVGERRDHGDGAVRAVTAIR